MLNRVAGFHEISESFTEFIIFGGGGGGRGENQSVVNAILRCPWKGCDFEAPSKHGF